MVSATTQQLENNFRHVLHYLDTADDRGDTYAVIDAGTHTVMDTPLLILTEDGQTTRETVTLDSYETPLEDRADIRLEPDTYAGSQTTPVGDWRERLHFDTIHHDTRHQYRTEYADTGATTADDLFSGQDGGLYTPDDALLAAFEEYIRRYPEL